jgi:hypothetical protein
VAAILSTVKVRAAANPHDRVSVKALALGLPNHAWRTITWREGSGAPLRSRFARVRVRIAPSSGAAGRTEETLLIEWPTGEAVPTKYWLSNLDHRMSFRRLVDIAKMRWRIEHDYQELKQEIAICNLLDCFHHPTFIVVLRDFFRDFWTRSSATATCSFSTCA